MADSRRRYTNTRLAMLQHQDDSPVRKIYLHAESPMNRGIMQSIFNWMRSGEWLSTVLAQELWKVNRSNLAKHIRQIERRGYRVESQTFALYGVHYIETFTQYRLLNWLPEGDRK